MEKIDAQQVLEVLDQIVEEVGPSYGYDDRFQELKGRPRNWRDHPEDMSCHYTIDGKPACIVGEVLSRVGIEPQDWRGVWESDRAVDVPRRRFTVAANQALRRAQRLQDMGRTWSEAVEQAKNRLA